MNPVRKKNSDIAAIPFPHARKDLPHRIATEFFENRLRENERDERLADHSGRWNRADIRTLDVRASGAAASQIHRGKWLHQSRKRLHRRPNDERLASRHSSVDSSGAIRAVPDI